MIHRNHNIIQNNNGLLEKFTNVANVLWRAVNKIIYLRDNGVDGTDRNRNQRRNQKQIDHANRQISAKRGAFGQLRDQRLNQVSHNHGHNQRQQQQAKAIERQREKNKQDHEDKSFVVGTPRR